MKRTIVVCALGLLGLGASAQGLPQVPSDSLQWRSVASEHMRKDAWCRETSIYWALAGGIFTALAANKDVPEYSNGLAIGFGLVTATGFATFQIVGARHGRKASRHIAGLE